MIYTFWFARVDMCLICRTYSSLCEPITIHFQQKIILLKVLNNKNTQKEGKVLFSILIYSDFFS
jgi:hypothetical protein